MRQDEYPYSPPFYAPQTRSRPRWVKGPSPSASIHRTHEFHLHPVVPHRSSQNRMSIVKLKRLSVLNSLSLGTCLAKGPRVVSDTMLLRGKPSTQTQRTESAMGMYIRNFLGPLVIDWALVSACLQSSPPSLGVPVQPTINHIQSSHPSQPM